LSKAPTYVDRITPQGVRHIGFPRPVERFDQYVVVSSRRKGHCDKFKFALLPWLSVLASTQNPRSRHFAQSRVG
jgi:hypothetical protein